MSKFELGDLYQDEGFLERHRLTLGLVIEVQHSDQFKCLKLWTLELCRDVHEIDWFTAKSVKHLQSKLISRADK